MPKPRRQSRQALAKALGKPLGVKVMGIDPAFRHTGWVCMELCENGELIQSVGLVRTKKSDKKTKILAADDHHRCCREIATALSGAIKAYRPHVICAESMVGSQSSRAANQQGMAWGILSSIVTLLDVPLIQTSPQRVKKALCGVNNASKDAIEEAVVKRYPLARGIVDGDIEPASVREHVYDSIAVVVACLDSTEIQTLRRLAILGGPNGNQTETEP